MHPIDSYINTIYKFVFIIIANFCSIRIKGLIHHRHLRDPAEFASVNSQAPSAANVYSVHLLLYICAALRKSASQRPANLRCSFPSQRSAAIVTHRSRGTTGSARIYVKQLKTPKKYKQDKRIYFFSFYFMYKRQQQITSSFIGSKRETTPLLAV